MFLTVRILLVSGSSPGNERKAFAVDGMVCARTDVYTDEQYKALYFKTQ